MMENKRALVVDDERLILKIISDILTKEGYQVTTAFNCNRALDLLKENLFHVVLTDIRMPEKNGIDLLEGIRALNPDLPVIMMTGFASLGTAMKAMQLGAFDYLTKPLDYNKLKSIIKRATEGYELMQENRRLLKELRELNKSLELKVRERNRELENILASTHESIVTLDRDLVIKSANPKTISIFGEDCIGQKITELIDVVDFSSILPDLLTVPSYVAKREVKYGDRFLEITLSPLLDFETGEIFGVIGVTDDITEKKKLEVQLVQSAKMSAVGQLAAGIAHEFNNILSGIMGYTSFAMTRESLEQIKGDLRIVEKASARAIEIVKKLLSFSRQRGEKFECASINETIEDALTLIEHSFELRGIKIVRQYGDVPPFRMNVGEIQQVILNMAINSKQAMPQGGVITITTELEGEYVKIDFSDTGIGIAKEDLSRIFDPFFTTKEGGSASGTGLGLSVIYAIIKRHDGQIEVGSEVGQGTTFTVRLPNVQPPSNSVKGSASDKEVNRSVLQTKRNAKILIVDDEEFICAILKECLSSIVHSVFTASTGNEAIELIKGNHFDIIFLDLTMPGKSGFDVLREIKTIDPSSIVVVLSGRAEEDVSDKVMAEGAFSFMPKPFTVSQVYTTVEQILRSD
ncbi:MAG: hypothetical protein C4291_08620 [Candidatus Dadabacteria bacterium]